MLMQKWQATPKRPRIALSDAFFRVISAYDGAVWGLHSMGLLECLIGKAKAWISQGSTSRRNAGWNEGS